MDINTLIHESHQTAIDKGWWEDERPVSDIFMNIIAEVSEAWEEYRKGWKPDEIYQSGELHLNDKPEGIPIELADVLMRIFDFCGRYKIDLEAALKEKLEYNKTRPYRHGNKLA